MGSRSDLKIMSRAAELLTELLADLIPAEMSASVASTAP